MTEAPDNRLKSERGRIIVGASGLKKTGSDVRLPILLGALLSAILILHTVVSALFAFIGLSAAGGSVLHQIWLWIPQIFLESAIGLVAILFLLHKFIGGPLSAIEKKLLDVPGGISLRINGSNEGKSQGLSRVDLLLSTLSSHLGGLRSRLKEFQSHFVQNKARVSALSCDLLAGARRQKDSIETMSVSVMKTHDAGLGITGVTCNLSELTEKAASAIVDLNGAMAEISGSCMEFHGSAQQTSSAISELTASINQITQNIRSVNESAEGVFTATSELQAMVKNIEQGTKESVELTGIVNKEASGRGLETLKAAMEGMENIKANAAGLAAATNSMGKKAKKIDLILTVLDDVASQTDLLALNSAILAAQAGASGKAFNVVSDEMRSLAKRAAAHTSEITELIKSVQDEAEKSISLAGSVSQAVEKGSILFQDVTGVFNQIIECSEKSTGNAKMVRTATTESVNAINYITGAAGTIRDQIKPISASIEEQLKAGRFIMESSENVNRSASGVKREIEKQHGDINDLMSVAQEVGFLALQISDELKMQEKQIADILGCLEEFAGNSVALIKSADGLQHAINSLDAGILDGE